MRRRSSSCLLPRLLRRPAGAPPACCSSSHLPPPSPRNLAAGPPFAGEICAPSRRRGIVGAAGSSWPRRECLSPSADLVFDIDSDGHKIISGLIPDAGTIYAHGSGDRQDPHRHRLHLQRHQAREHHPLPPLGRPLVDVDIIGRIKLREVRQDPCPKSGEIPVPFADKVEPSLQEGRRGSTGIPRFTINSPSLLLSHCLTRMTV